MITPKLTNYWLLLKRGIRSQEARGAFLLSAGGFLAQIINLSFYPFITRWFSPVEFGQYSFVMTLVVVLSAFTSFQIFNFLPVLKEDVQALALLKKSLKFVLLFVFSLLLLLFIGKFISQNLFISEINEKFDLAFYAWFFPLLLLVYSVNENLKSWNIRHRHFSTSSSAMVANRLSCNLSRAFFYFYRVLPNALVISELIGNILSVTVIFWRDRRNLLKLVSAPQISLKGVKAKYGWNFLAVLLAIFAVELPVLLFPLKYSVDELGQYSLAMRLTLSPILIISSSLGAAMLRSMAEAFETSVSFHRYLVTRLKPLAFFYLFLLVPVVVLGSVFGETIFLWFFSLDWQQAGGFVAISLFFFISKPILAMNYNLILTKEHTYLYTTQTLFLILGMLLAFWATDSISSFLKIWIFCDIVIAALFFFKALTIQTKS